MYPQKKLVGTISKKHMLIDLSCDYGRKEKKRKKASTLGIVLILNLA
jgi:hypothetical protein